MIVGDVASYDKFQINGKSVRLFGISQPYNPANCPENIDKDFSNYIDTKINEQKFEKSFLDIYVEDRSIPGEKAAPDNRDPFEIFTRKYFKCLTENKEEANYFSSCPQAEKADKNSHIMSTKFNLANINSVLGPMENISEVNTAIDYFYGNKNALINNFKSGLKNPRDLEDFKNQSRDENIKNISNDFIRKMYLRINFGEHFSLSEYINSENILVRNYLFPFFIKIYDNFESCEHENCELWKFLEQIPELQEFILNFFKDKIETILIYYNMQGDRGELYFNLFSEILYFNIICKIMYSILSELTSVIIITDVNNIKNYMSIFESLKNFEIIESRYVFTGTIGNQQCARVD